MYHCGTPPVLAHIANGMYGAIVVDPTEGLPKADRSYVLEALTMGIRGYVLKSQAPPDLLQAIREVCHGATYLSPRISETAGVKAASNASCACFVRRQSK